MPGRRRKATRTRHAASAPPTCPTCRQCSRRPSNWRSTCSAAPSPTCWCCTPIRSTQITSTRSPTCSGSGATASSRWTTRSGIPPTPPPWGPTAHKANPGSRAGPARPACGRPCRRPSRASSRNGPEPPRCAATDMPWRIIMMAIATALTCTTSTFALAADGIRSLARTAGIRFGTAVNVEALGTDAAYSKLLTREFDLVTPENAMKFSVIQPERGRFDFTQADALVAFAEARAMQVNGHVLVWDQQLPDWLTQGHFNSDELKAILREHIQTVVARYRGRVASWDVAAEAVGEDGKPRETFWSRGIGPDYLALAFRWAHAAAPQARLRYNDYGGDGTGATSDGIYPLVADLRAPRPEDVRINMKRLAALGLQTDITEMDVMLPLPASRAALRKQAVLYGAMLQACLAVPQCRSFSTWGATDRYSWIPEFFPGQGAALLFDADGRAKPAYYSIRQLLRRVGRGEAGRSSPYGHAPWTIIDSNPWRRDWPRVLVLSPQSAGFRREAGNPNAPDSLQTFVFCL